MNFSEPIKLSTEVSKNMNQLICAWTESYLKFYNLSDYKQPIICPILSNNSVDQELSIFKIKNIFQKAIGGDVNREFIQFLNKTTKQKGVILKMVIVWVDLIDVLIQHSEKRYGTAKNLGTIKSAYVKETIKQLLQAEKLKLPNVPKFLIPFIFDGIVDWLINTIVLATNKYGLWDHTNSKPSTLWTSLLIIFHQIKKNIIRFLLILAWPFFKIAQLLRPKVPLPPGIKSAIEAVRENGIIDGDNQYFFKGITEAFIWIGENKEKLIAAIELIFEAVQEAERFLTASGAEKKKFALQIVFAALTDSGFKAEKGWAFDFLEIFVDGAIEVAVNFFNRRGAFAHRKSQ